MAPSQFYELLSSLASEHEKSQLKIKSLRAKVNQLKAREDVNSNGGTPDSVISPIPTDIGVAPVFTSEGKQPASTHHAAVNPLTSRVVSPQLPCTGENLAKSLHSDPLAQPLMDNGCPDFDPFCSLGGSPSHGGDSERAEMQRMSSDRSPDVIKREFSQMSSVLSPDVTKRDMSPHAARRNSGNGKVYELLPAWIDDGSITQDTMLVHYCDLNRTQSRVGEEMRGGRWYLQKLVSRPHSLRCVLWDITAFLIMLYDCIVLPLQPFDLQPTTFTRRMSYFITVFWTCDVALSFTRGYHSGVSVEMRPKQIAKRYIQSWFGLDVLIATFDWFFILSESGGSADILGLARVMKTLRILRVMKMLRLFRIIKLLSLLEELNSYIHSEAAWTALSIFKLIVMIVLVNHFLACGWYAVGIVDTGVDTWVTKLEENTGYSNSSFGWHYSSALHWSITQFTPASMEIVPCNVYERSYAICVILFALVTFSSFVSSITSAMTHIRTVQLEENKQEKQLHTYIAENFVSMELGKRILVFLKEYRRAFKTRVHEDDIPVLAVLPESVRLKLHAEIFSPILTTHPLFDCLADEAHSTLAIICHKTVSELTLTWGQELCSPGQPASGMYFIVTGKISQSESSAVSKLPMLHNGDYLCEMALWLDWIHQDIMVSEVNSEVVVLNSSALQAIAPQLSALVPLRLYAKFYLERLNAASTDVASVRISDAWSIGEGARLTTYGFATRAFADWQREAASNGDESPTKHRLKKQTSMSIKHFGRAFSGFSSVSSASSERSRLSKRSLSGTIFGHDRQRSASTIFGFEHQTS